MEQLGNPFGSTIQKWQRSEAELRRLDIGRRIEIAISRAEQKHGRKLGSRGGMPTLEQILRDANIPVIKITAWRYRKEWHQWHTSILETLGPFAGDCVDLWHGVDLEHDGLDENPQQVSSTEIKELVDALDTLT